jgi:uncharacterized membrane protein YesL
MEARIPRDVCPRIGVMIRALPRCWVRSVGLGLLMLFPVSVGLFTLPLASESPVPFVVRVGLAGDVVGLAFLTALYLYAFPLLVLYDARLGTALSNALILASRHLSNTLGLLGMGVIFGLGIVHLNVSLLLVLPVVWGMFVVNNCRMVLTEEMESSAQGPVGESAEGRVDGA